jgi:selenide,water dikinase
MGGKPLTALAIACFPEKGLDMNILARIMSGGLEKLREAGVVLLGGHTVSDQEIKFGYSITGLIHPDRVVTNAGAQPGDALVLTKPIGVGILTSGIKFNRTSEAGAREAIRVMTGLNRTASEIMLRYRTHAASDITGNGLLGHAFEIAEASRVVLRFHSARVPVLQEALSLAEQGLLPRTLKTTWKLIESRTRIGPTVPEALRNVLVDPQTSGGLLISIHQDDLDGLLSELRENQVQAGHVGTVEPEAEGTRIEVD